MTARWEARLRGWLFAPAPRRTHLFGPAGRSVRTSRVGAAEAERTFTPERPPQTAHSVGSLTAPLTAFLRRAALPALLGFVAGRAAWLGGPSPTGVALIAGLWNLLPTPWLVLGAAAGGLSAPGMGFAAQLIPALSSMLMLIVRLILKHPSLKKAEGFFARAPGIRAFLASLVWLVAALPLSAPILYERVVILIKAVSAFGFVLAMERAAEVLTPGRRRLLAAEDIACTALSLGALLLGAADFSVGGASPLRALCLCGVILMSAMGGAGVGAAGGVAAGVVLLAAGRNLGALGSGLSMMGALAFSGWLAGSARRFGRLGVAVAQGVAMTAVIAWNAGFSLTPSVTEWAVGAAMALIIPPSWVEILRAHVDADRNRAAGRTYMASMIRGETAARLAEVQEVLGQLLALRTDGAERGSALGALGEALRGLSRSLLDRGRYDEALAGRMLATLDQEGVRAREAVAERRGDALLLTVEIRSCMGHGMCGGAALEATERAAGARLRLCSAPCGAACGMSAVPSDKEGRKSRFRRGETSWCRLTYESAPPMSCVTGIARSGAHPSGDGRASAVNGDSCLVERMPGGKVLCAISDGRGTGGEAARESARTLSLVEGLLRLNVTPETSSALINRAFLEAERGPDMYATIDAALIDLQRGEARLWRNGAATGALVRDGKAALLPSDALPPGVAEDAPPALKTLEVRPGDILVQVSDGVAGAWEGKALLKLIGECSGRNPQAMAERILSATRGRGDDRTVLVTRFYK